MKILACSDLHGRLDWFDWLVRNEHQCDVLLLAGDLIGEAGSPEEMKDAWAQVAAATGRLEQSGVLVAAAEGNHDLTTRHGQWLRDHRKPRCRNGVWVVGLPWLDTEFSWVEELRREADRDRELVIVLQHDPPLGTRVAVPGCWESEPYHAFDFAPHIIVSGHMHEAPFRRGGSWWDRQGNTYFFNAGAFAKAFIPCHIVLDLTAMTATWYAPLGRKTIKLEGLEKFARA